MKQVAGKELARVLERHGWILKRVHGSHHIYGREGSVVRLSIPVHAGRALKRGLLDLPSWLVPESDGQVECQSSTGASSSAGSRS
jgi:predicted RNA binding protein YcfA (HicA-like mRNA interferase family)